MTSPLPLNKVHNPRPGWYRGDFHCHTLHSDGVLTPPELAQLGQTEKLDFFAITDHNTLQAYEGFGANPGLLVIPGIEVTYKGGHFNVFGIEQTEDWLAQMDYIPAPRAEDKYNSLTALMARTASLGLLNSINHPRLAPWAWEFPDTELRHLHCLEIWNDPSWPDNQRDNPRAIELWTEWLNDGWRITGIGGSDFHRPQPPAGQNKPAERLGQPTTHVYAENLSGQAILAAVRQRRAWVSMGGTQAAFQAQVNGQAYDIGAEVGPQTGAIELRAAVTACPDSARAQIVRNGAVVAEAAVTGGAAEVRFAEALNPAQPVWYRFDVYGDDGLMRAITNPIFAGTPRAPSRRTYGEF
jgi:hypothetical protein